jgi:hypothetical protein
LVENFEPWADENKMPIYGIKLEDLFAPSFLYHFSQSLKEERHKMLICRLTNSIFGRVQSKRRFFALLLCNHLQKEEIQKAILHFSK